MQQQRILSRNKIYLGFILFYWQIQIEVHLHLHLQRVYF